MTKCITQLTLESFGMKSVVVDFDAPEISSDGGCPLLRQVDGAVGVSGSFAGLIADSRSPSSSTATAGS
jgi:hypothetical protein